MRISDWSSDVCSSDLCPVRNGGLSVPVAACDHIDPRLDQAAWRAPLAEPAPAGLRGGGRGLHSLCDAGEGQSGCPQNISADPGDRSEEHTSELQSLMRISYAVFCLKKKKYTDNPRQHK